jgi:eukaryotic-like serine/threonine-protein kinase
LSADDRALARVAASIADGESVDWQHAEASLAPAERRLVRHLRLVESISTLHRTLPLLDDEPAEDISGLDAGALRWGRLVLHECIGRGTSCEVFRAWDTALHREVALKLLHTDGGAASHAHTRMLEEARRLARVNHDNVVGVYGAEQHEGRVGLWMELVGGESLDAIVRSRGRFSAAEAALVGQHLCAALAAVHAAGLLHRDVKAQNVMRDAGGRIVLMDFGTGEAAHQDSGTNRLVGTPLYLAPEIFDGRPASTRTDLYSLGVTLFHLVTGKFPHDALSMDELAAAHARDGGKRLRDLRPDLPRQFVAAIERALERDPARRYRTAGEMEAALRQSVGDATVETPVTADGSRRWRFAAVAAALMLAVLALIVWTRRTDTTTVDARQIRRIAVLPLTDLSPAVSPPYFADAITDRLSATLADISEFEVTSPNSTRRFKGSSLSVPEIGRALQVDGLLQGSITVLPASAGEPQRVRLDAKLLAASTGAPVWSRSFGGTLGDMAGMHGDVARALSERIGAAITPEERAVLAKPLRTSAKSEEAYLAGRYHLGQPGIDSVRLAVETLRRAIEIDPANALARAELARAYLYLGTGGAMPAAKARMLASSEARQALAIDETLPEAHAALADAVFYYDWNWAEADREYRRAIELRPSAAEQHAQYSRFLAAARRLPEAVAESEKARRLDPASAEAAQTHGLILFYAGHFEEAEKALQHASSLDPQSARALVVLGRVYEAQRRYPEALQVTERAVQMSNVAAPPLRIQAIRLQALAGQADAARAAYRALTREYSQRGLRVTPEHMAYLHLAFGEHDRALTYLEEALDEREPGLLWLAVDPRVEPLRGDDRFRKIARTLGIP